MVSVRRTLTRLRSVRVPLPPDPPDPLDRPDRPDPARPGTSHLTPTLLETNRTLGGPQNA